MKICNCFPHRLGQRDAGTAWDVVWVAGFVFWILLKGQGSYSNLIRGFGFWFLPLTILKYIKMTSSGISWQRKLQIVIEEHCQKLSKISLVFQICIYMYSYLNTHLFRIIYQWMFSNCCCMAGGCSCCEPKDRHERKRRRERFGRWKHWGVGWTNRKRNESSNIS